MRLTTNSARDTEELGARIAKGLGPGDLVLVVGEVGAGKTTLIRGCCRALGVKEPVTSPTFTIGQRYRGASGIGISHLDLYRLSGLEGEDPALLDDYLDAGSIAFVEWPAAAEEKLGRPALEVRLGHAGGESRTIELVGASPRK
ncbi:MAG: tRNA (adenosine(37)-N6)-threonylcarbamoyltransferase complex ATPase subunit type 1 TsaE [Solirubrobacterales bacterium]